MHFQWQSNVVAHLAHPSLISIYFFMFCCTCFCPKYSWNLTDQWTWAILCILYKNIEILEISLFLQCYHIVLSGQESGTFQQT
jgi:hypothetical protein